MKLSKHQQKILNSKHPQDTVFLIEAIAGGAKSSTAVDQAHNLHTKNIVKANKQRLITFSVASTKDLQSKIKEKFKQQTRPKVSTIHGLCVELLRDYVGVEVTVLTQWQSLVIIRNLLEKLDYYPKDLDKRTQTSIASGFQKHIDFIKSTVRCNAKDYLEGNFKLSTLESPVQTKDNIKDSDFSYIVKQYEIEKDKQRIYDYADLLFRLVIYLEKDPRLLKRVRNSIDWLFVDECLEGNMYVVTDIGRIKIKELYAKYRQKEKLPLIKSYNIEKDIYEYKEMEGAIKSCNRNIYNIKTEGLNIIRATENHPLLTQRGYVKVEDIKIGLDYVLLDSAENQKSKNHDLDLIKSIEFEGVKDVYDIKVKDNHNFCTAVSNRKNAVSVIVHNCQDCQPLDYAVILLLSQNKRLMLVSDPLQEIYQFRYSDSSKAKKSFIKDFFKKVKQFKLPINYRSTANIVEFGNYIRNIKKGTQLQGVAHHPKEKGSVQLHKVQDTNKEAIFITTKIQQLIKQGYKYKEIVIIAPTNAYLNQTMEPALVRCNIPYKLSSRKIRKKLTERDIVTIYKLLIQYTLNPLAKITLVNLLEYIKGIGEVSKTQITKTLLQGDKDIDSIQSLPKVTNKVLDTLKDLRIQCLELTKELNNNIPYKTYRDSLTSMVNQFGKPELITEKSIWNTEKTLAHYYNYYKEELKENNLTNILKLVIEELDIAKEEDGRNQIRLSTVHAEKGLSQKITIATGFVSHRERDDLDGSQTNMFYVQCSRAEKELHIVYSDRYVTKDGSSRRGEINKPLLRTLRSISND